MSNFPSYPEAQQYPKSESGKPVACAQLRLKGYGACRVATKTLDELKRMDLVTRLERAWHQKRGVDTDSLVDEIKALDEIAHNRICNVV